jgi:hypothetical protein
MFNAQGSPLQYFRQSVDQKFSESEYRAVIATGITHTMSLVPKPGTARIRLLVCDTATGMIGSVDVPYPAEPPAGPVVQAEDKSGAPSQAMAASNSAAIPPAVNPSVTNPAAVAPHVIKFHDKAGHTGILQWDTQKISYSGDLSADASARGMFESLWGKSYACVAGKLVSLTDKATVAQQPLHFKSENHGADVYLDAESVKFSGDLIVDPTVKPLFEALRELYQCKSPAAVKSQAN